MKHTRTVTQTLGLGLSVIFLLTVFGGPSVQAEEEKLYFPKNAKEIETYFLKNNKGHSNDLQIKGLQLKGVSGIVKDEKTPPPTKVGALILFDYDSATIKAESHKMLKEFATALKGQLRDMKMTIAGHTDSSGSYEYNWELSKRRARAVKDFLVSHHNIKATRLKIQPYGESDPIESNKTAQGRAMNRRVEFSDAWE